MKRFATIIGWFMIGMMALAGIRMTWDDIGRIWGVQATTAATTPMTPKQVEDFATKRATEMTPAERAEFARGFRKSCIPYQRRLAGNRFLSDEEVDAYCTCVGHRYAAIVTMAELRAMARTGFDETSKPVMDFNEKIKIDECLPEALGAEPKKPPPPPRRDERPS